jgi:hypothetical protein
MGTSVLLNGASDISISNASTTFSPGFVPLAVVVESAG